MGSGLRVVRMAGERLRRRSRIGAGFTNREIAERLVISETTVKTHINHVFAKIEARDRAAAINYATPHGLGPA